MKQALFFAALCLAAAPALSQTLLTGDHSIEGKVCIGDDCEKFETYPAEEALKINGSTVGIGFEDASDGNGFPDRDWRLLVNDDISIANGGLSRFSVEDIDAGTIPFTIEGGAPANALYVDEAGDVGIGTSLPAAELHIVGEDYLGTGPVVRLEDAWGIPYVWELTGNETYFGVRDRGHVNQFPLKIYSGTPNNALVLHDSGNVGVGTIIPQAPFELLSPDTFTFFRLTAAQATVNKSVDITFTGGPLGTGELRYNVVDGDGPEMKLNANGDMEIDGTLTTGGPTCAGGCDAVFDSNFKRLSVAEHAALMWKNGHLPAVGTTRPGAPMNVAEKIGGILNELEHAHIYIAELEARDRAREAENARLGDRVARLEAMLAQVAGMLDHPVSPPTD